MKDKKREKQIRLCDKILRTAISGTDEEFKSIVSKVALILKDKYQDNNCLSSYFTRPNDSFDSNYLVTQNMTRIILIIKGDVRKYDIMTESLANIPLPPHVTNRILMPLIISCIRDDDEMIHRALDSLKDDNQIYSNMLCDNPLYILYLFGKKDFIRKFMDKVFDELPYPESSSPFFAQSYNFMCFYDFLNYAECSYSDEISECLFGHRKEISIRLIPFIARCPEMLEYLIQNKYQCFGIKDRKEPPGFDEFLRKENPVYGEELIIRVLYEIHSSAGGKTFKRFFDNCTPVTSVRFSKLCEMNREMICTELSEDELEKLLAPEITVRFSSLTDLNMMYKAENLFCGHRISYDLSETDIKEDFESEDEGDDLFYFGKPHIMIGRTEAANFLRKSKNIPHISSICGLIKCFLDFNSKQLTKLMISKGLINSDNLSEAVAYASEKKELKALCELSHLSNGNKLK